MKATRALLFFAMAAVASATSVTFTFDTQTINGTTITGIAENASTASIQSYMNQVLSAAGCTGCTVTLTGGYADTTYNADGNVVGPGGKSLTLGTSNNATSNSSQTPSTTFDTFLANTSDSGAQMTGLAQNQITMKFSGFTINGSASFAYEIFPNINCQTASCGANMPDFKFEAGTNSTGTDPFVTSFGTNGDQLAISPSATGADGSSTFSPNGATVDPQYIGTWAGSLSNVNELDFVDWPATVGVDNLSVSWTTTTSSPVPEPFSVVLLGTIVGGIVLRKKIRKAVA